MDKIKIEDYFNNMYSNSALYMLYRSVASYVDGLKPSQRKIIYTIKKQNITEPLKVSVLAGKVGSFTEYLHGESSMQGTICTLAADYCGANNMNVLSPEGNFGSRMLPAPSSARYIYTKKSEYFDKIFRKEDDEILIEQEFEGKKIEPKFYLPVLPLILINGSEGIGVGYSQYILPRNPNNMKQAIKALILGKKINSKWLYPWFNGFKGTVEPGEEPNTWYVSGIIEQKNTTTLEIKEIPIGYSLLSYIKVLKNLEDKNIIKSFEDRSEKDDFNFKINVSREFTKSNSMEDLIKLFKLRSKLTENLTCEDENNSVVVFNSVEDLLIRYIEIKNKYLQKRKEYLLDDMNKQIVHIDNIVRFCKGVIDKSIKISNIPKQEIIDQLASKKFDKENDSYDYLLNLPIHSISKERYEELLNKQKNLIEKREELKIKEISEFWINDLEEIKYVA